MSTFISYSQLDAEAARAIELELIRNDIKFWRDNAKLLPGDQLSPRIFAAIEAASSYVILVSASSLASTWVAQELTLAVDLERQARLVIVVVRLDDTPLPVELADKLYVDLRGPATAAGLRSLVTALRAVDDPAPPVGRSETSPRTFVDHGIEVGRTESGGFLMQLDVVSFDLDEQYTVLSQYVFRGDRSLGEDHDDKATIDRVLAACAAEFVADPARVTLKSGEVKQWAMTVVGDDGDDLAVQARVRRLGAPTRGTVLFNVGAPFVHICETYGLDISHGDQ